MPEPDSTIIADQIISLHPKSLTIKVKHALCKSITVNLPITTALYKHMLKVVASSNLRKWLPLIFYIDNQGMAYDAKPLEMHNKKVKQAETKANDNK
jgi:hypothetical protein